MTARKRPAKPKSPAASRATGGKAGLAILIVDDHPLWRQTLRTVLQYSGATRSVTEASTGLEALAIARAEQPDVVIMDIDVPGMNGVDATAGILADCPESKVLVLSSTDEPAKVLAAVRAGACGYLVKTSLETEILDGIRRVADGELVFPPELADRVFAELRSTVVAPAASLGIAICGGTALDREGLARLLGEVGFRIVGHCSSPEDLHHLMHRTPAEVALVDTAGDPTWISCLQEARSTYPDLGVLILSDEADSSPVVQLITTGRGGIGQLFKRRVANIEEVTAAVVRVASGEVALDPEVVRVLVEAPRSSSRAADPIGELTEREQDVLALMAEGHSNTAIGERLFLSSRTVEAHTSAIFNKFGLEATADTHRRVLAVVAYLRSRHGG